MYLLPQSKKVKVPGIFFQTKDPEKDPEKDPDLWIFITREHPCREQPQEKGVNILIRVEPTQILFILLWMKGIALPFRPHFAFVNYKQYAHNI
jgi:hypothetical protein